MKKKILAVTLVVTMMIVAVTGATLAYLTDTKSAVNTFTVGHVKIQLNEQQRGENGLEPFKQDKKLYPIVGSAQGDKDQYGMPVAKNYVDKMITVTNTGSEDAYIRVYFAIPSALDNGYETFNAGLNVLHFNFGNKVAEDGTVTSTAGTDWVWTHGSEWNYFETEMDEIKYNVYFADYQYVVKANETTTRAVDGVYLDKSFNMTENGPEAFGQLFTVDDAWDWSKVSCPVYAVAVQAQGFDSCAEAMDNAFGATYNPWGTEATNWQ